MEGSEEEDSPDQEVENLPAKEPTVTRSGGIVRPPQYIKNYVIDFKKELLKIRTFIELCRVIFSG